MNDQNGLTSRIASTGVPAARIDFSAEDRTWIAERIAEVLETGQLTLGKYCSMFEESFAALCRAEHAVSVNSGTSALEIIFRSIGVDDRDVLIPANTFFATAAAVMHAGGRVVLTDADCDGFGPTVAELDRCITKKTAAIVVVHIGGMIAPNLPEIRAYAKARGVRLVEDAAHAHGCSLDGRYAGTFGDAAAFSFYPTKVMTSAEGGMIVTDDADIAKSSRIFRDQGKASFHENSHVQMGYNWRMSEPHAIIGVRHLSKLDQMLSARRRIASIYDQELTKVRGLRRVHVGSTAIVNYYKYIAMLPRAADRTSIKQRLKSEFAVSLSGEVYQAPIHRQPIFSDLATGNLEAAEAFCASHICLPVFASMEDSQARHVVDALHAVLKY